MTVEKRPCTMMGIAVLVASCGVCAEVIGRLNSGEIPFRVALLCGCAVLLAMGTLHVTMCHWIQHLRRWTGLKSLRRYVEAVSGGGVDRPDMTTVTSLLGEQDMDHSPGRGNWGLRLTREDIDALIDRCEQNTREHRRLFWRWFAVHVVMVLLYTSIAVAVHILAKGAR